MTRFVKPTTQRLRAARHVESRSELERAPGVKALTPEQDERIAGRRDNGWQYLHGLRGLN